MIKDLVLKSQFVNFLDSWGLKYSNTIEEAYAFEKFVNYLVLSQDDSSTFIGNPDLLDSCCVGGGEDAKLDGIGIKINGNLVGDIQDIEQIVDASKKIDVEFFLIQSKERSSFDSSEFNTFGIGAQNFFSDPKLPESQAIKSFRKMKDLIYSDTKVIRKLENNPSAHIVYAFCGTPPQDEHTEALKKIVKQNLESCPISLNEIRVEILGTTDLIRMSKEIANDYTIELTIKDIIPLTTFENKKIKKAYSFTCEAIELVKLLSKDDGTIRKSLFYENVRDYLGNQGGVNSEIEKTLKEEPEMFLMCNNGITIVCSDFNQIRDKLVSIQNPQIVNGCQTSHSIFHFRNSDSLKNVHVLVKIVCTDEYEITNKIVRGTNKQNQVLEESFETTKPFHQHLEDYFSARRDKVSLYYERRNKQYASNPTINKFEIANLRVITQTLVGMFLQSPHIAHRHEAKLLEMFAGSDRKIYREGQSLAPYYISALTWFKFEEAFRLNLISSKYKKFKAHLYAIFIYVTKRHPLPLDSKNEAMDNFCNELESILTSERFISVAKQTVKLFSDCYNNWISAGNNKDGVKESKEFSEIILTKARETFLCGSPHKKQAKKSFESKWLKGEIFSVRIKDNKWFAFIRPIDHSENIYFDNRNYSGDFKSLLPRTKVLYTVNKRLVNGEEVYYAEQIKIL